MYLYGILANNTVHIKYHNMGIEDLNTYTVTRDSGNENLYFW